MLDKLLGELVGVDRIGPRLLEGGVSVLDAETVLDSMPLCAIWHKRITGIETGSCF